VHVPLIDPEQNENHCAFSFFGPPAVAIPRNFVRRAMESRDGAPRRNDARKITPSTKGKLTQDHIRYARSNACGIIPERAILHMDSADRE